MAVSKRLRHEVMRRDNHACRYCGGTAPNVKLTIDHVTPVSLGGQDVPENLVTACADCNAGKAASNPDAPLVADVEQKATEYAQAMQVVIARRAVEYGEQRARAERFDAAWRKWSNNGREIPRDDDWRASVVRFLAAGITDEFLADAVDTAMNNRKLRNGSTWRYFCGICWREIDNLHAAARKIAGSVPTEEPLDLLAPGRAPFDYMTVFDAFLDDLVPSMGGNELVREFVDRLLWEAMPEAHAVYMAELAIPRSPDLDDDEEESAPSDAAADRMRDWIREPMHELRRWRTAGADS